MKLKRITSLDREEMKKKEREQKKLTEEELSRPVIWIKYTLGLKHQVNVEYVGPIFELSSSSLPLYVKTKGLAV